MIVANYLLFIAMVLRVIKVLTPSLRTLKLKKMGQKTSQGYVGLRIILSCGMSRGPSHSPQEVNKMIQSIYFDVTNHKD